MDGDAFGDLTEAVRERATAVLYDCRLSAPAAATRSRLEPCSARPCAVGGEHAELSVLPMLGGSRHAHPGRSSFLLGGGVAAMPAGLPAGGAPYDDARSQREVVSAMAVAIAPANLSAEDAAADASARELLALTPRELLFAGPSSLSEGERREVRFRELCTKGAGSIRKCITFVRAWVQYCREERLQSYLVWRAGGF